MRSRRHIPGTATRLHGAASILFLALAACGGSTQLGRSPATPLGGNLVAGDFTVEYAPGPIVYAVEAALRLSHPRPVERISFSVRTKDANLSKDVQVTYERSYLERVAAIEQEGETIRFPVFGLYAGYANQLTIQVTFPDGSRVAHASTILTPAAPDEGEPSALSVHSIAPTLGMSFMLLQGHYAPTIVDIDGEVRWQAPEVGVLMFPRACTRSGLVAGCLHTNAVYRFDWLGRVEEHALSDPRYTRSHHNIEPGKTGLLNTVTFKEGRVVRRLSELAEMTLEGVVTRAWNFDRIFSDHIAVHGEDATSLVQNNVNWFHMNSAVYDASDDSLIVSSRENFVVKVDYETGAIKWLLGNPAKRWYLDFPASLQPLTLALEGDPPIGQHALSVSADGEYLMLFNNGQGNKVLPDVGDSRTYSKVSVYRIDQEARTAEEIWNWDCAECFYSPPSSSAYRTEAGNVLVNFARPEDSTSSRIFVVDEAKEILFDATLIRGGKLNFAYAMEEICLGGMVLK